MKKKILLALSFVLVAVLSVGATLALLTYQDSDHNTMTIGQAKIEQLEYQRVVDENGNWVSTGQEDQWGYTPDKLEEFKQDELLLPTTGTPAWDDRTGKNGDPHQQSWAEIGAPGSNQLFDDSVTNVKDKFVFVKNTGSIDIYFRTIILIEAPEGTTGTIGMVGTGNARYDWDVTTDGIQGSEKAKNYGYITVEGTRYAMYCAQYMETLVKDQVSRPSLLQVYMSKDTTTDDIPKYGEKVDVLVLSQAVQAKGYADATTALNDAFGALSENNHPWLPQN